MAVHKLTKVVRGRPSLLTDSSKLLGRVSQIEAGGSRYGLGGALVHGADVSQMLRNSNHGANRALEKSYTIDRDEAMNTNQDGLVKTVQSDLYKCSRIANLAELIERLGGVNEAAEKLNYSRTRLSQLQNGIGSFGQKIARKLERQAGLPEGHFDVHPDTRRLQAQALKEQASRIPVFSWAQIVERTMNPATHQAEPEGLMPCPVPCGQNSFVVKNETLAMSPDFNEGAHLFVDPDTQPRSGDPVLVGLPAGQGVVFRYMRVDGARRYLVAASESWPDRVSEMPVGATIIGVVVFSGSATRRS